MTLKNNRAPLLCHIKLCASFQSYWWIQTGVTIWKRLICVKIGNFFVFCDLEIWWMTLKNNRAPLLCNIKPCASFCSHRWIQTGIIVRKCPIWVKIYCFVPCDLKIWWMTLKNNRAPLLCRIKHCASFHSQWLIQIGFITRKRLNWVLTSVTLTFCMDITSVNGNNSWKFHDDGNSEKGVTDGQTDWTIHRAAWSQLKIQQNAPWANELTHWGRVTHISVGKLT